MVAQAISGNDGYNKCLHEEGIEDTQEPVPLDVHEIIQEILEDIMLEDEHAIVPEDINPPVDPLNQENVEPVDNENVIQPPDNIEDEDEPVNDWLELVDEDLNLIPNGGLSPEEQEHQEAADIQQILNMGAEDQENIHDLHWDHLVNMVDNLVDQPEHPEPQVAAQPTAKRKNNLDKDTASGSESSSSLSESNSESTSSTSEDKD